MILYHTTAFQNASQAESDQTMTSEPSFLLMESLAHGLSLCILESSSSVSAWHRQVHLGKGTSVSHLAIVIHDGSKEGSSTSYSIVCHGIIFGG